jgi:hypothetical protein
MATTVMQHQDQIPFATLDTGLSRYGLPREELRSGFAQFMETQQRAFGHASFCGAHAQYILDEDHTPRLVDGYSAIRWRAAGGSMELGTTEWAHGWHVATRLDQYGGEFYTFVVAQGYDVNGITMISRDPKKAMENHRDAVKQVMKVANYHGLEASPSLDTQVLLEPALA